MNTSPAPVSLQSRPYVRGKFLYTGQEKFFVKGVTYGAFAPNSEGHQFPEPHDVKRDFGMMQEAGINSILTYTLPPLSLLDEAQAHGLRVMPVVPWMEYICFLQEEGVRRQILKEVRDGVAACRRHPAIMMFCVGKEIPPPIVRWHGRRRVERFLNDLYDAAKDEDPTALVTYTSYPTTEYLKLPFVDVCTFNVYLHQRPDFCKYVSRLQHQAGELPLVLTELGMCSLRHGEGSQADFIDWQLEEAFDHGLAGAVVFGWTDPFFQDGNLVTEWGFGLVDGGRRPKPSYRVAQRRFTTNVPFSSDRKWPRVSVVVASHNAASTLTSCLESLQKLHYPNYEVIVVNDGSTDGTQAVMDRFPFINITTPNQGVSAARNVGLKRATGEIVAYIDSDADADPDWLHYLVATYQESDVVGVGGPNFVPPADNWVAKCVYRSPGGPTQVMLDDRYAEHIPGCNMSFRKAALEDIGGFDPIFTKAADDVDVCWRLIDRGYRIGFSPSAVVWHHRRPSVKAYWRQQVGYGVSESILEKKMPNKFNPWGHTFWAGRIYAPYPSFRLLSTPTIYHGLWGSAPFQPMYNPGGGNLLTFLPRAMEFHFALTALMVVGLVFPPAFAAAGVGIAYAAVYSLVCAWQANLDVLEATESSTWLKRLHWRGMIAWLHLLEPVARDWGRLKGGLTPWRNVRKTDTSSPSTRPWWKRLLPFRRSIQWNCAGNMGLESYNFLDRLSQKLTNLGCAVGWNPSHETWDLRARRGALAVAKVGVVVEHHGGAKRLMRVSGKIAPPESVLWLEAILGSLALLLGSAGFPRPTWMLAGAFLALWVIMVVHAERLERVILSASAEIAEELQIVISPSAPVIKASSQPTVSKTLAARAGD